MNETESTPWIIPLFNFESDADLVTLNDRICLRRIEPHELEKTVEGVPLGEMIRHWLMSVVLYVLEVRMKSIGSHADNIILTFRLLKSGDVKGPMAFQVKERGRRFLATPYLANILSENTYSLSKNDAADFRELYRNVENVASKPYLDFSLKTFMEAYDEKIPEDRIVNYMAALESMVFYGSDKAIEPAGAVMGMAVGMMLGRNQPERDEIRETLSQAYYVRNARVHGNVKRLKKLEKVKQISDRAEEYLRRTLRKFIEE